MALIAQQKLRIAKLERQVYGQRSERSARPIEQLALKFEELEASATEDELAAERAVAETTNVRGFTRRPAERNTFPEHLPRERVVIDPPKRCECCGGLRLRKLGEDVARTLETEPRRWKVIRPCGRSSPAGTARRSPSPLLRTMSSQEGQAPRRPDSKRRGAGGPHKSALYPPLLRIDAHLLRWVQRMFKRFRQQPRGARAWLAGVVRTSPDLFAHWPLVHANVRTLGAV
jgi:Transposase C of IS166 homeodomain/zinc-finger binding domain of transposase IS66